MIWLGLLCLALVALLAYRERASTRDREAERLLREALERRLIEERQTAAEERSAAADERRNLYQRIQAPEDAVHEAKLEARRERPYTRREPIGADDDAAYTARQAARKAARAEEVNGGG